MEAFRYIPDFARERIAVGAPHARRGAEPALLEPEVHSRPERAEEALEPQVLRKQYLDEVSFVRRIARFNARSTHQKAFYEACKRALDVALSLLALIVALPLLVVVGLLVVLTSRGPVFFKHRRLGRDGREFWCIKFRTMVSDAHERLEKDAGLRAQFDRQFKVKNDCRITPIGAFLRKTSLDELPQLMNVLAGQMSLIGPRPIVRRELEKYGDKGQKLLTVRPGLGGLWQCSGRSDTTYAERVVMDMLYIDHRCVSLDLQLLWSTAVAAVKARGAQ